LLVRKLRSAVKALETGELGDVVVSKLNEFVMLCYPVLPPVVYMSLRMRLRLGYWPNIRNPRSLNEKIVHRQLFAQHPLASLVSDKWRMREYVAQRGLAEILNEVYFVTEEPEKIPFDDLPDRFVIKANHGSAWNIFVTDKRTMNRQEVVRQCREWLGLKYSKASRTYETHVDGVAPVILVERYIQEEGHEVALDYKFMCFHGKARYVYVVDRVGRHPALTFYDMGWNRMDMSYVYPTGEAKPKPAKLGEMTEIAERLSTDFDFVRVDLYSPNDDSIVAGEITLSPTGGSGVFHPREWDFRLGDLW